MKDGGKIHGWRKNGYKVASLCHHKSILVAQFETGLGMDKFIYIWGFGWRY